MNDLRPVMGNPTQEIAPIVGTKPKVSVILTSFNHGKYIRDSIDSILSQTFTEFELIIWDDASSDDSWEIIGRYGDPRIKAYRNDETRRYVANRAIQEVACGEFIAIHHSDDVWERDKLARQVTFLEENPDVGAVFCRTHVIDETGRELEDAGHYYATIFDQPNRTRFQWLNFFFYHANALCHPSILIRKKCYEECGVYRRGLGQLPDLEMWIRLCFKYEIHVLPERLVRFRVRSNEANASGNRPETQVRTATEFHLILENYLQIKSAEEMLAIFPEAEADVHKDGFEPEFILARLTLQDRALPWARLFGLSLLYRLLADPEKALRLKEIYDFDYRDFIALTGKYQVFPSAEVSQEEVRSQRHLQSLNDALRSTEAQVAELQQRLHAHQQRIFAIESSRSWKLVTLARRLSTGLRSRVQEVVNPQPFFSGKIDHDTEVDADFYLRMYPDIARLGLNPVKHYRTHGRQEGRLPRLPSLKTWADLSRFSVDRETVLIIPMEASGFSFGGAMVEVVRLLGLRYNLIALVLEHDEWETSFRAIGAAVVSAVDMKSDVPLLEELIGKICRENALKYALVSGVGTIPFPRMLARHFVPVISWVHDAVSMSFSGTEFENALVWSDMSVFSSQSLLANARAFVPYLPDRRITVLYPPLMPSGSESWGGAGPFQGCSRQSDEIVVLGEGSLSYPDGVDLFVACAAALVRQSQNFRYRFIWIWESGTTTPDQKYVSCVVDQIQRMGVAEVISYFDKSVTVPPKYADADLYLSTARVGSFFSGLDVLAAGLPVLCFEQGIVAAEVLSEEGLGVACVAPYLDIQALADKVQMLAENAHQRREIGEHCRQISRNSRFSATTYVSELEKIAQNILMRPKQIRADIEEIQTSGGVRHDFASLAHLQDLSEKDRIHGYILSWSTGIRRTKPTPGFHPAIYEAEHGLSNPFADPFADYLRAGRPHGRWVQRVIEPVRLGTIMVPENQRIALHLHVFYPHLLGAMLERLELNTLRPDLFVSLSRKEHGHVVMESLSRYTGRVARLEVVPNRGRDIGPLLTQFGRELLENYDIIGHLHTKLSPHAGPDIGSNWYLFLLENLLGGKGGAMMDTLMAEMDADPGLGLVFPDNPHPVGWDRNWHHAQSLAHRLGIENLPEDFNFPVGTMFWARADKLRPLIELDLTWTDYPAEPLATDGTLLHAIERMIPFLPSKTCANSAVVNVSGLSR